MYCSDRDWNAHSWALFLHWLLLSHGEAYLYLLDSHCSGVKEAVGCTIRSCLDMYRRCYYLQCRLQPYASNVSQTWQPNRPNRKSSHFFTLFNVCLQNNEKMREQIKKRKNRKEFIEDYSGASSQPESLKSGRYEGISRQVKSVLKFRHKTSD